jgi:hypothetical protein
MTSEGPPSRPVDFRASTGQPSGVDVLKVLLYMAAAALVAALGLTWKDFKRARAEEPPEKVFEVNRQIREIRLDQERMQADRDRITGMAVPPPAPNLSDAPLPPSTDVDLAAVDAASTLGDSPAEEEEMEKAEEPARAKAIAAAPVVAKISEWVESNELGVICTLQVTDTAAVKAGSMLSVRRNAGIIARMKVDKLDGPEALASPTAVLGELKPQAGDELIVDPEAK